MTIEESTAAADEQHESQQGPTAAQLRRFIKSRPYVPLHELRRRFELNGDLELAAQSDRGTYTALLFRVRLARMLTPRNRVWGALGLGGAGYQTGSLTFGLAAGTSLMLVPKFGLDLSANLDLLGASSSNTAGVQNDYPGGAVLLIAVRALFELHR